MRTSPIILLVTCLASHACSAAPERVIELSVITDYEAVQHYGGSVDSTKAAAADLVNQAAQLFRDQLNYDVVIKYIEVPADQQHDRIPEHTHAGQLKDAVTQYRYDHPEHLAADITLFLTPRQLQMSSGMLAGFSNIGAICSGPATAIVSLEFDSTDYTTIAHELAHVLGAEHDGNERGPCGTTDSGAFLMSRNVHGSTNFSDCSIKTMRDTLSLIGECTLPVRAPSTPVAAEPKKTGGGGVFDIMSLLMLSALVAFKRKFW